MFDTLLHDLRYASRSLSRTPGFSLTVVLTLALGLGASTAIFSAVYPILFEPLPYSEAHRVVTLTDRTRDGAPLDVAYGTYLELVTRSRSLEALAVSHAWRPALAGSGEPEQLVGNWVSANYFRALGVAPALGRDLIATDFDPSGAETGAPQVAIVSDGFAKRRFGGAAAVVGRTIRLDGVLHTVIGIMPSEFENVLAPEAEVWAPLQYRAQTSFESREWGHSLRMIGRLAPGMSIEQARDEISAIAGTPVAELPRPRHATLEHGLAIESLLRSITAGARPLLLAILGAVLLLLVIACANVTNLLLARGIGRRAELAVRAALGAARPRLLGQLLTESLMLAALGGAAGLGVAMVCIDGIVALAPVHLPRVTAVRLNAAGFLFAAALTTLVGLGVGLIPALRGTRSDVHFHLKSGLRATAGSHALLRRGIVVTEVALALVLLVSAGLVLRSVERLLATSPGFNAANVMTLQIVASGRQFESQNETLRYFQTMLEAVGAVPGVRGVALTNQVPLSGDYDAYGVRFESETLSYAGTGEGALRYVVTPEWFRTLQIPLIEGRLLDAQDQPTAPGAVVISESFAKRRFGDRSAIGERVRIGPDNLTPERPWRTVVGVVGDLKQTSLARASQDAFYVPLGQWPWVDVAPSLVVRTAGDPLTFVPAVKEAIWSVDSSPALERIASLETLLAASAADRRFARTVLALFATAALALAILGLYGVLATHVLERTHEIGLRAAIGASPGRVLTLILRQGMTLAASGIAIGLGGAAVATRALENLLYGITALDPLTYACVAALLFAVAAIACWIPALRAIRLDPLRALREE
ncbi:MAG: ABC transporter permease [Gammaproteobacteria bacterium]|nr:ABC transporter permease [Gammaproteobacteria bacterium]